MARIAGMVGNLFGLVSDYTIGTAIVLTHLLVIGRGQATYRL